MTTVGGCAAGKSVATVLCDHVNMDQNLCGMFLALVEFVPRRTVLKPKTGPTPASFKVHVRCTIVYNKVSMD